MISPKKLKALRDKWMVRRKIAGRWLRLRFSSQEVQVHQFGTDATLYAEGAWIFLQWHVDHAWSLHISGVGRIHPAARVRIRATQDLREMSLTANGRGGPITRKVQITVRPRHEFVAEGTPNAAQAWPPREGFAVPASLRHLMLPNRKAMMHQPGSGVNFRPAPAPQHGPWRHSPPAHFSNALFQSAGLQQLQRSLSQIRNAASLAELKALKNDFDGQMGLQTSPPDSPTSLDRP